MCEWQMPAWRWSLGRCCRSTSPDLLVPRTTSGSCWRSGRKRSSRRGLHWTCCKSCPKLAQASEIKCSNSSLSKTDCWAARGSIINGNGQTVIKTSSDFQWHLASSLSSSSSFFLHFPIIVTFKMSFLVHSRAENEEKFLNSLKWRCWWCQEIGILSDANTSHHKWRFATSFFLDFLQFINDAAPC